MKNIIKGYIKLTLNFIEGYCLGLRTITTKEECFWTLNQTFFCGSNSNARMISFQKEFNELVERHKKVTV